VPNSILFFETVVSAGTVLDKAVTDSDVYLGTGCVIGTGDAETPNRQFPDLLNSGITLVGKGVRIPANIEIGRNCIISPELKEADFSETRIPSGYII
jgi:glucose-1-phosphate adenylyltransferase